MAETTRLATGKLPPDLLRSAVFSRLGARRPETLVGARLGIDAAAINLAGDACVLTVDPITTAGHGAGRLAVLVATNDLAAMGAQPMGVLPTLLLPRSVTVTEIEQLAEEIHQAALALNVEVLGGHTEIAPGVTQPLVVMAAVGRVAPERLLTAAGGQPGDTLVLTKAVALEGTSILAHDFADRLAGTVPADVLARARVFREEVSVVPDGLAAASLGAHAMHDPTEGGLLGALWELAEASRLGCEVAEARIPLRAETIAICRVLGADPLRLIASGAMLIACADGPGMVAGLAERGVAASVIGTLRPGSRTLLRTDGGAEEIGPPERDELYRLLEDAEP